MKVLIAVNDLIQYFDDSVDSSDKIKVERVLYMDSLLETIIIIDMKKDKAIPEAKSLSAYLSMAKQGLLLVLDVDPWLVKPRHFSELSKAEKSGLESAQKIIEAFTSVGPLAMFDESKRGHIIRKLEDNGDTTKPTIYAHLRRYWRGGQTFFTLIPLYSNRGGRGKTRVETAQEGSKRGRPSIKSVATGDSHGMNIDEASRLKLVALGKEYYEKQDQLSLKKVYDSYIAEFFNKGVTAQHEKSSLGRTPRKTSTKPSQTDRPCL